MMISDAIASTTKAITIFPTAVVRRLVKLALRWGEAAVFKGFP